MENKHSDEVRVNHPQRHQVCMQLKSLDEMLPQIQLSHTTVAMCRISTLLKLPEHRRDAQYVWPCSNESRCFAEPLDIGDFRRDRIGQ